MQLLDQSRGADVNTDVNDMYHGNGYVCQESRNEDIVSLLLD